MKLRKKNVARKLKKRKSIDEYKGVEKNIQRKTKSKNKLQMQEKGCASEHATVLPLICMHNYLDMHSSNMPLHICMNTYICICVCVCLFLYGFLHFFGISLPMASSLRCFLQHDSCVPCLIIQISSHTYKFTCIHTHIHA